MKAGCWLPILTPTRAGRSLARGSAWMFRRSGTLSAIPSIRIRSLSLHRLSFGRPPGWLRIDSQQILAQFDHNVTVWSPKTYRRKIIHHTLTPQLTEEEATRLLRISTLQAIYNARAYCREFDQLTGSQQMALSQLVFQMGTNLEQFVQFLDALNDNNNARELAQLDGYMESYPEHWKTVQGTLIDSQWARRYSSRAATVIAMFDPEYSQGPNAAEERIEATLRPPAPPRPREPLHSHSPGCQLQQAVQPDARQESTQPPDQAEADLTLPFTCADPTPAKERLERGTQLVTG